MPHLALTAVQQVKALIVAASTRAGASVEIGRTRNVGDEIENDSIVIDVGEDSPPSEIGSSNLNVIDSTLRVHVDLYTRTAGISNDEKIVAQLFELRAQVHAAILADHTLGLGFVISVNYQGAERIASEAGGDLLGAMRTSWDVRYRTSFADPTVQA